MIRSGWNTIAIVENRSQKISNRFYAKLFLYASVNPATAGNTVVCNLGQVHPLPTRVVQVLIVITIIFPIVRMIYSISSLKENLLCASHFFRHPERPDKWWCLSPRSPLWPPSNRSPSPWQADAIGAIKVLGLAKTFTLLPPAARVTFCNSNWKQHQNFIIIITFSTVVTLTINPLLVACFWGWEPERCERDREGDARPSSLSLFLVVSISNFGVHRQSPKIIIIIIIMIANVNLRNLECCLN